jgi:hypothetical protein
MARRIPIDHVEKLKRQGDLVAAIRGALLRLLPIIWPEIAAIRARFGFAAGFDLVVSLGSTLAANLARRHGLPEDLLCQQVGDAIVKRPSITETVHTKGVDD